MTALTLPFPTVTAAEVAVRSGWAVVDGVPNTLAKAALHQSRTDMPTDPPPEWVRAAKPCDDCGGRGIALFAEMPCSACHGVGKPRVEVTTPCGCDWHSTSRWHAHSVPCDHANGSIHVAWVTVTEVLPVVPFLQLIGKQVLVSGTKVLWWPATAEMSLAHDTPSGLQFTDNCIDITADVAHLGPPAELVERFLLKLEAL